jgi:hypothetical protein
MLGTSIGMGCLPIFIGMYIWWYLWAKAKREERIKTETMNGTVVTFDATDICVIEHHSVV